MVQCEECVKANLVAIPDLITGGTYLFQHKATDHPVHIKCIKEFTVLDMIGEYIKIGEVSDYDMNKKEYMWHTKQDFFTRYTLLTKLK